jgi:hypothetical protein
MVKQLFEKLKGLHFRQEYLCIPYEHFMRPLHVYVILNKKIIAEVTKEHLFIGYAPLIIVLPGIPETACATSLSLAFFPQAVAIGTSVSSQQQLASLHLKPLPTPSSHTYQFFEGLRGHHHFLPLWNRWIIRTANQLYKDQPGNVFLQGNLYEQVQVAYSVPRIISLITVQQDQSCNVFPTDLHGEIEGEYIISLRTGGKALEQVTESKKIVVAEITALAYKKVYAQGKNHMRATQPRETFDFENEQSRVLHFDLPKGTVSYRELQLKSSFHHGIHTILIFRILHQDTIRKGISRLSHVHNAYATWRFNNGWKDSYLLR